MISLPSYAREDLLAAVRALAPRLRASSDEIEAARSLSEPQAYPHAVQAEDLMYTLAGASAIYASGRRGVMFARSGADDCLSCDGQGGHHRRRALKFSAVAGKPVWHPACSKWAALGSPLMAFDQNERSHGGTATCGRERNRLGRRVSRSLRRPPHRCCLTALI